MNAPPPPVLWRPTPETARLTTLSVFAEWLRVERGVDCDDYEALWQWSTDAMDEFWQAIWDFFEVRASTPPERVLGRDGMPGAEWFPKARLNWAEHVLRAGSDEEPAIIAASEAQLGIRELSWQELRDLTARIAAGLRRLGVQPGDRVAAYVPNTPEAIAALLACASLGAVWSSSSPDFGLRAVIDRFAQIEPTVLIAVDGYRYGGKRFDRRNVVSQLRDALPSVRHVVILPYLDVGAEMPDTLTWKDLIAERVELDFAQVPFDHPLWVLYSSGTTGLPKGIVHGHGGILLEQLNHNHLHLDVHATDRVFWFTTTGWMMWNLLAGCLLTGATIVLFDGNPGHPTLEALWELAVETGVTVFGTSASYIASCMKAGVEPADGRDLTAVRTVGSTGSPLSPDGYRWVYDKVGQGTWLVSMSGGSDLCTAFVCGNPLLPVYEGELQCRALASKRR